MCVLCAQAESNREDMTHYGLEGEDDAVDGAGFDQSLVDANDEDGETDTSGEAAYDKAGILSFSPSIWDPTTSAALKRAPEPHARPPVASATLIDQMLNTLKSRQLCRVQ